MDLLNTDGEDLYFVEPLPAQVEALMLEAADKYETGEAELPLLRAYLLAGDHLTVLVGLYRYYYYQHRYQEALRVAEQAINVTGERLGFSNDWPNVMEYEFVSGVRKINSIGLARFYLLALKGMAYINLRLGRITEGVLGLNKILLLDPADRIGARELLAVVESVASGSEQEQFEPCAAI